MKRRIRIERGAAAAAALGAGATAVLSLPPFSILPAAPLAYSAVYLLIAGRDALPALGIGWAFGLGYFGFGLSWIAESFFVDAERFGWMGFPAVAALSACLALFPALACAVFARLRLSGLTGAAGFAACWLAAEWLRGHVLTGFPWNLPGYALADFDLLRQPAAWFGIYGLSFLTVFIAVLPAVTLKAHTMAARGGAFVLAAALPALLAGLGVVRLATAPAGESSIRLRIVQGNVPQSEKWRPDVREEIFSRYLSLSARPGTCDLLLWPETAFPGYLDEDPEAVRRLTELLTESQLLLTGVPDRVPGDEGPLYFNTIQTYDSTGGPITGYAKHHLVPFGEYVPHWMPLARLVDTPGDFTPGPGPRTLAFGRYPLVAATICYEAIFPGHVVDPLMRPDLIFNAANDAWFGSSIGPYQHLAAARMRAVEEGLPLARAANTGVSAVFDAYGRSVERLGLEETGILDADLPPPLSATLYAWLGDFTVPPLIALTFLGAWSLDARARRRQSISEI